MPTDRLPPRVAATAQKRIPALDRSGQSCLTDFAGPDQSAEAFADARNVLSSVSAPAREPLERDQAVMEECAA